MKTWRQIIETDARELMEKARQQAELADSDGALAPEVVRALCASGLADVFAHYRDRHRLTFRELMNLIVELDEVRVNELARGSLLPQ
ncbi:hypothetical protein HMPREF1531_01268 [Propionibacterium sp. oral taxon 192 str. F0372]|uniref:hypothetical protein n=1 Tax=Propionibacterium sp. oral taxon 192 TaxID=671222 RepID=UPI000353082E|nr:hypothetical protein [Propionibacterium sp. oral taxon 192]EPH03211.1 hypothetical protein HMPREF1531_01268 [Propionibacterium sp. oral taxon 192 str. F0372]